MKRPKKETAKDNVVNLTEARDLVNFIDEVFGGKLYPFRSYREVKPETPPDDTAPTAPK